MLEVINATISQEESASKSDFYQVLKACLDSPNSTYKDKVNALSKAWEAFSACSIQYSEVIPYLYNDTIMIVLQFEWGKLRKSFKSDLNTSLQNAASNLVSSNTHAYYLCLCSLRIVKNPWNYPIVTKITNGTPISKSEGRDFLLKEMPILMNARLDRICWDDKCKDLALKLVAFYRKCFQDSKNILEPHCSVVCRQMWLDLHVALLYICGEKVDDIFNMSEEHFSEGLDIVKRLVDRTSQSHAPSKRSSGINRIWREHGMETAEFASQWLLSTAFIRCPPPKCLASLVIQHVNLQKKLGKSSLDIIKSLHALLDNDQLKKLMTSAHMYILCATLFDKFGDEFKSFCIEFYVKAVIVDLNYLEKQKWDPKTGGVKSDEIGLAAVFSKLAELVRVDIRICKEMALAAFSLHPTQERFDKLVELAAADQAVKRKSPSPISNDPCLLITKDVKVPTGIDEIELESTSTLEEENKSPYTDLAAATLGLSEGTIQELGVIVDGVRWQVLTWNIGWKQLEPLCRRYMNDKETMRSVTNELNFLNIDYSQFKDMPRPERGVYWGIEKGYENCLELAVAVPKRKSPSLKADPRRSKSKKSSSRKKGSRNSPSDVRSRRSEELKRKTWMRRTTLALKSSSESEKSMDLNNSKTSSEVVPDGVKRSARIQASKRTSTEVTRDSASLVKRLREIRLDFGMTNKWRYLSPKSPTTKTQQSRKVSSYRLVANHFAPMLSTLNMQPKVVLTRTTMNSTTHFFQEPSSRSEMSTEASEYCHPWIPIENMSQDESSTADEISDSEPNNVVSMPSPTKVKTSSSRVIAESSLSGSDLEDLESVKSLRVREITPKRVGDFSVELDKCILQYIILNKRYSDISRRKLWMDIQVSCLKTTGQDWKSIKRRFHDVILKDLESKEYALEKNVIQRFRSNESSSSSEWDSDIDEDKLVATSSEKTQKSVPRSLYTLEEDKLIIDYIAKTNRYEEVRGKKLWVDIQDKILHKYNRSWQSAKNRLLRNIFKNLDKFNLSPDIVKKFKHGAIVERNLGGCQGGCYDKKSERSDSSKKKRNIVEVESEELPKHPALATNKIPIPSKKQKRQLFEQRIIPLPIVFSPHPAPSRVNKKRQVESSKAEMKPNEKKEDSETGVDKIKSKEAVSNLATSPTKPDVLTESVPALVTTSPVPEASSNCPLPKPLRSEPSVQCSVVVKRLTQQELEKYGCKISLTHKNSSSTHVQSSPTLPPLVIPE